jgi:hypothetical protein
MIVVQESTSNDLHVKLSNSVAKELFKTDFSQQKDLQGKVIKVEPNSSVDLEGTFSIKEFLQKPLEQTNNALAKIVHQSSEESETISNPVSVSLSTLTFSNQ